jgi:hypothetical protein
MKLFDWSEQREAIRYAAAGGQALHTHRFGVSASSPAVFRSAVRGRNHIAHLFDWNAARLPGSFINERRAVRPQTVQRRVTLVTRSAPCSGRPC